jgi:hypothetical protein
VMGDTILIVVTPLTTRGARVSHDCRDYSLICYVGAALVMISISRL